MHAVLLVDDGEETEQAMKAHFKRLGVANPLKVVRTAEEGIKFLSATLKKQIDPVAKAKAVIINLHLSECQGSNLLQWIQSQPALKHWLRIVLVERNWLKEVVRAYELGASTFLVKPLSLDDLNTVLESFPAPWIFASPSVQE